MPRTNRSLVAKEIMCLDCETVQIIHRLKGRNRKRGHIKHIWCFVCKGRKPHQELGEV